MYTCIGGPTPDNTNGTGLQSALACYTSGLSCRQPPVALVLERRSMALPDLWYIRRSEAGAWEWEHGESAQALLP
jgi:hypothetical protein